MVADCIYPILTPTTSRVMFVNFLDTVTVDFQNAILQMIVLIVDIISNIDLIIVNYSILVLLRGYLD